MNPTFFKNHILIFFLLCLSMLSCKKDSTVVDPPVTVTPGKQTDIEWPSLAKSSWPMHHGNPQSTGRFNGIGPNGNFNWQYNAQGPIYTSVVIDEDTTIYFFSNITGTEKSYLHAISANGTLKFKVLVRSDTTGVSPFIETSPIVADNGTIYVGSTDTYLYAFDKTGTEKWKFKSGGKIFNIGMTIGKDGTIYFVANDGYLYVVNNAGILLWKLKQGSGFDYSSTASISMSTDGLTIYATGLGTLNAINTTGELRWTYSLANAFFMSAPVIDNNNNIFISVFSQNSAVKSGFYSIDNKGQLRWIYAGTVGGNYDATIDYNGNVYFIVGGNIVSVTNSGERRWDYGTIPLTAQISLVSDKNNVVYIAGYDTIFAFNNNGSIKWKQALSADCMNSPAFMPNGNLIIPTWYKNKSIYSIK